MGIVGTKSFHANATIRYKGNLISQLTSSDGTLSTSHSQNEGLTWKDFKERSEVSEFNGFMIDLGCFIERYQHLNFLQHPLSKEEIEKVIKELPNDKSHIPNGFNNEFMKHS